MRIATHLAALALAFAATAAAADIYQWTDEQGRVHYGDQPAPGAPAAARPELRAAEPSEADRQEAIEREERLRARLQRPADESGPAEAPPRQATRPAEPDNSCAAQWARYHASQECFAPYRNVNGSVRVEAYRFCTDIPEPQCEMP